MQVKTAMPPLLPSQLEKSILEASSFQLRKITVELLKEAGIRPSDKLGQNFTVCREYIDEMSRAASSEGGDVLEIGTGTGILTSFLSSGSKGLVISVEKDPRLFELASRYIRSENAALILGDGLLLLERSRIPMVVSSTPFYLSVPIILSIARNNSINVAVLGVQREVAERIAALPGSRNYGRISVISSIIFETTIIRTFRPSCFFPKPKVSVSIVKIARRKAYDRALHGTVEELSACLFSQRNKIAKKVIESCIQKLLPQASKVVESEAFREAGRLRVREISGWQIEEMARAVLQAAEKR